MNYPLLLFALSIILIFWTNLGYFLFLKLYSKIYQHTLIVKEFFPTVTIIITAYNEEKRIAEKLESTLELDYPQDKLEIIIVSDGSSDNTIEIVKTFESRKIKFINLKERSGKHFSQWCGIQKAQGEIIVFSDATTSINPDGIIKLVRNFADPSIGCVSSKDKMISSDSESSGEGVYVKYEMKIRELESVVGSLVGVSGSFFGVRKHLCEQWIKKMSSDFYLPLITYKKGFRTILECEALGHYEVQKMSDKEYTRKVRTVVHGLEVLFRFKEILNPFKYGFFAFQVISHKLLRWLVPFLMIITFVENLILFDDYLLYELIMYGQLCFYLLAALAYLFKKLQEITIFKIPFFFVMVNLSIFIAWYKFLTKKDYVIWESTKR